MMLLIFSNIIFKTFLSSIFEFTFSKLLIMTSLRNSKSKTTNLHQQLKSICEYKKIDAKTDQIEDVFLEAGPSKSHRSLKKLGTDSEKYFGASFDIYLIL